MALFLLKPLNVLLARPPWPVLLLVIIATVDMITTAVLYSLGQIVELNPIMRPLLHGGVWPFCIAKGATIVAAYIGLQWYRSRDEQFVLFASKLGVTAYLTLWIGWFIHGTLH